MRPRNRRSISQAMLEEFRRSLAELSRVKKHHQRLRERLLDYVDEGYSVEPGDLSLAIRENSIRSITFAKLVAVLGGEEAERLRDRIPPSLSLTVTVSGTNSPEGEEEMDLMRF